jgi:hypothetical protein
MRTVNDVSVIGPRIPHQSQLFSILCEKKRDTKSLEVTSGLDDQDRSRYDGEAGEFDIILQKPEALSLHAVESN